jgi:hypothetical protein
VKTVIKYKERNKTKNKVKTSYYAKIPAQAEPMYGPDNFLWLSLIM